MNNTSMQENNGLPQLKSLLSRMMAQVDFMIRNDRPISQLDIDVMMEKTREFYDVLCCINGNKWNTPGAVWSVKKDNNASTINEHDNDEISQNEKGESHYYSLDDIDEDESVEDEKEPDEKDNDIIFEWNEEKEEPEENNNVSLKTEEEAENNDTEETTNTMVDELGMKEESKNTTEAWSEENQKTTENPIIEEHEIKIEISTENPAVEATQHVTIGDILEKQPDNSIASQLQRKTINDLRTAIGINERFLFLNDLFKGSMEKYNKSLSVLNEINNLDGAIIYMHELQVELQWDENSLAYKKLMNLVERRF